MADLGCLNEFDVAPGIAVRTLPNGYVSVALHLEPIRAEHRAPSYDIDFMRLYIEEVAVTWLEMVAPHRLAFGAETHG